VLRCSGSTDSRHELQVAGRSVFLTGVSLWLVVEDFWRMVFMLVPLERREFLGRGRGVRRSFMGLGRWGPLRNRRRFSSTPTTPNCGPILDGRCTIFCGAYLLHDLRNHHVDQAIEMGQVCRKRHPIYSSAAFFVRCRNTAKRF
jgi:hypothetical protein